MADDILLEIKDLQTIFTTYAGTVRAVDGVSLELRRGEAIALVGESGCGKSVTALSVMRLVPDPGRIVRGSIMFDGVDVVKRTDREMQHVRGNDMGMIFQDPMTALNPVLTIGLQMMEVVQQHQNISRRQARRRAIEMMDVVGIPNAASRMAQYPHQFSGGMRQRVMIAMALSCNPKLLIADEPSTSLDVTIQAQILDLMKNLRAKFNSSIILITHDLAVVAGLAQRVLVMYAGKIIEHGPVREVYYRPKHPYSWALLKSVPRLDAREKRRLVPILGQPPDLIAPPPGCRFNPRCEWAMPVCLEDEPGFSDVGNGHLVACWLQHPMAPAVEAFRRGAAS